MAREIAIRWDGNRVTGRWRRPRDAKGPGILLAHGAGTTQDHQSIITLREGPAAYGHPVLMFNYPYTEQGKGRPDRPDVLLACHRAATKWLQQRCDEVVLAGRSMGGRMATHLAAQGESCAGVVLYSYPLHPAGKPEKLRKDHLPDIAVPMLFFSGDKDALALPDLVDDPTGTHGHRHLDSRRRSQLSCAQTVREDAGRRLPRDHRSDVGMGERPVGQPFASRSMILPRRRR